MFKKKIKNSKILQKTIVSMLIAGFSLSALTGCGKTPAVTSTKEGAKQVSEESGSKEDMVVTEVVERGLRISVPKEAIKKGVKVEQFNANMNDQPTQSIFYYYTPITDKLFEDMLDTPAEERTKEKYNKFYKELYTHSKCLMNIVLLTKDEYQKGIDSGKSLDELSGYDNTEELGKNGGYIYLVSIPVNKLEGMSEEEKKLYEECRGYMKAVKNDIEFIPIKLEKTETVLPAKMPSFSATDLNGNPVTENIFSQKDITMVNVWGTFCSPCIEEMPDLGEMARSMPENVQMVGYITDIDGDKNLKTAKNIVSKAKADFTQIVANNSMTDFTSNFVGVPATFFVDKDGNILGEPIVGGTMEQYRSALEELLK